MFFKNDERKNNSKVEKVGCKNSVNWNHKDSDLIHVDQDHIKSNQHIHPIIQTSDKYMIKMISVQ